MRWAMLGLVGLGGCAGSWADVGGSIGGVDFTHPLTVYHGGPFVVLVDRDVECRDMGWVKRRYHDGVSPREEADFVALQLTLPVDEAAAERWQISETRLRVDGLLNEEHFELHHGREGFVEIDEVGDGWLEGHFSVSFTHDGVGGAFRSEECRSLSL